MNDLNKFENVEKNRILAYTWSGLIIFGFIVFIVGLFLIVEASMYTKEEIGYIKDVDLENNSATVVYLDLYQLSGSMNDILNSMNVDGSTIRVMTMPKTPSNAVFSPNGVQTAGYILLSIGGAILITFMFVKMFVP